MDLELKTATTLPASVTPQKPAAGVKPETAAPAATSSPPTSGAAAPVDPASAAAAQPGSPADKPGRRAAAARKAEREAAAKITEANQKTTEAKTVTDQAAKYADAIKSGDPDKILAAFGLDDEKLVDMYIAKHGTKDPGDGASKAEKDAAVEELKAELAKFKQDLADEKTKTEEKRKSDEATTAVRQHLDGIKAAATKPEHADRFEMVNAEGPSAYELAFDVMVEVHKQHGKFLTHEEALDLTENHLLAQERARIDRNAKLKKLGGAPAPAKADEKPTAAAAAGGDSTIESMRAAFKAVRPRVTNGLSVSTPATSAKPRSKAEADQRFRAKLLSLQTAAKTN